MYMQNYQHCSYTLTVIYNFWVLGSVWSVKQKVIGMAFVSIEYDITYEVATSNFLQNTQSLQTFQDDPGLKDNPVDRSDQGDKGSVGNVDLRDETGSHAEVGSKKNQGHDRQQEHIVSHCINHTHVNNTMH